MKTSLFSHILVPVDFSPCSEEAFQVACDLARLCEAKVTLLYVIDMGAVASLNRLGLLPVPSDAAAERSDRRHHSNRSMSPTV